MASLKFGKIKFFNAESDRRWGFIRLDDGSDAFFHENNGRPVKNGVFVEGRLEREPKKGDRVILAVMNGKKGPRAEVWGFDPNPPKPQTKPRYNTYWLEEDEKWQRFLEGDRDWSKPHRERDAEVRSFFEGQAMQDRVRLELEKAPVRYLEEPNFEPCRCAIFADRITQMEERAENADRIPHADVESTYFVYRVSRFDCPLHINQLPSVFLVFRDCGEYPLDNERVRLVGTCDERRNPYGAIIEDNWYATLRKHGYSDPRDYID